MRTILIAIFALSAVPALACDDFRSAENPTRHLRLTDGGEFDLAVIEKGETVRYFIASAGTGTGITVAKPETLLSADPSGEILEIKQTADEFWLGPERFTEACE